LKKRPIHDIEIVASAPKRLVGVREKMMVRHIWSSPIEKNLGGDEYKIVA
jgi:hypothetical protein